MRVVWDDYFGDILTYYYRLKITFLTLVQCFILKAGYLFLIYGM